MSWLQLFAKMIGVAEHQAEDALHSERAARATLSRRNLFAGGAALAAGSVFSFPAAAPPALPFALPLPLLLGAFPLMAVYASGFYSLAQKGSSRS